MKTARHTQTRLGFSRIAAILAVLAVAPAAQAQRRAADQDDSSQVEDSSDVSLAVLRGCDSAVRGRLSPDEQVRLLAGIDASSTTERAPRRSLLAAARFAIRVARAVATAAGDPQSAAAIARLRDVEETATAEHAVLVLEELSADLSTRAESEEGEYVTVLRAAAASYSAAAYLVSLATDFTAAANADELETEIAVSVADLLDNALIAGGDRRVVSLLHATTLLRELAPTAR